MTKKPYNDKPPQPKPLLKTKISNLAPIAAVSFFAFSAKKIQANSGTKGF